MSMVIPSVRFVGRACLVSLTFVWGCSGSSLLEPPEPDGGTMMVGFCASGETAACVCTSGRSGTQGCNSFGVWDACVCDDPPVAIAGSDDTVSRNVAYMLDGTASYDVDSATIGYAWSIVSAPAGSGATLVGPATAQPTLSPDLPGLYVIELEVSDAVGPGSTDQITLTAVNDPPVALIAFDPHVVMGQAGDVDGSGSSDMNGDPLTYSWEILGAPAGSTATLSDASAAIPTFEPDVEGEYEIQLTVYDGFEWSPPATTTFTANRPIDAFPFMVVDAEHSAGVDAIVMVSGTPSNQLHLYPTSAVGGPVVSVDLPLAPVSVSVSPDGLRAAVGHPGWVSIVDLTAPYAVDTMAVSTTPFDIVFADNGFVYAFPETDQWVEIHCLEIATGDETLSGSWSIRAGTRAKLRPGYASVYGADNGLSPSDIEHYDISGGTAAYLWDSPYHGDYAMCGDLWFLDDGSQIITGCGNTFWPSDVQMEDMIWSGVLDAGDSTSLIWVEHVGGQSQLLVIPDLVYWMSDPSLDGYIHFFSDMYWNPLGTRALPHFVQDGQGFPSDGLFVFASADEQRFYAVVEIEDATGYYSDRQGVVAYDFPAP